MNAAPALYLLMAKGYLLTVILEGIVLFVGLRDISYRQKLFLSFWLTAITYPFVWLIFSLLFNTETERVAYLVAAEIFAPIAECLAFKFAFANDVPWRSATLWWSFGVIVAANLFSFGVGALVPWWL